MKRMFTAILLIIAVCTILTACNRAQDKSTVAATQPPTQTGTAKETTKPTLAEESSATQPSATAPAGTQAPPETEQQPDQRTEQAQEDNMTLRMSIGGTPVEVAWEDNEAVEALRELCKDQALTIDMSMYGGFEQVGSIGTSLPQDDVQTTTKAGDIMLYSGDQMVVFYGSNTWAYTPLGHITDKSEDELTQLLANGDTTLTINLR